MAETGIDLINQSETGGFTLVISAQGRRQDRRATFWMLEDRRDLIIGRRGDGAVGSAHSSTPLTRGQVLLIADRLRAFAEQHMG
jgi:hypothetical protein